MPETSRAISAGNSNGRNCGERMNWRDNWSEELAEYMMTHDGFYGRRLRWWERIWRLITGG